MTIFNWLIILSTISTVIFTWATFLVESFKSRNEKSDLDEDEERLVELMGKVRVFVDSKIELLDKKTEEVRALLKQLNQEIITMSALSIDKDAGNTNGSIDKPTHSTKDQIDEFNITLSEINQTDGDDNDVLNNSAAQKGEGRNSGTSFENPENVSTEERIFEMFLNGMGPVEIAKTLKMGVGEVSLIIDLMKRQHH